MSEPNERDYATWEAIEERKGPSGPQVIAAYREEVAAQAQREGYLQGKAVGREVGFDAGKREGAREIVQKIVDDVTFLGLHPEEDGCMLCDLRRRIRALSE